MDDLEQSQKLLETGKEVAKVGRPTAITRTKIAKLEEAFKMGATIEDACSYVGIDKSTYHRNIKSKPKFATKMDIARRYVKLNAKANVATDIKLGDIDSSKWWLEHKHSDEFSKKPDIALQVNTFTVDFIEHDPDHDE